MNRRILTVLVLAALSGWLAGGDFWEQKPFTRWNRSEIQRILTDSPWTYLFKWKLTATEGPNRELSGSFDEESVTIVRVQLFSSHPVRQAWAALVARGNPQRLQSFRDFALRDYPDEIVVAWTLDSQPRGDPVVGELESALRNLSLAELKANTSLVTDTGHQVVIKDYIPPTPDGTGAKFIFPRHLPDGRALVGDRDKTLRFITRGLTVKVVRSMPVISSDSRSRQDLWNRFRVYRRDSQLDGERTIIVNATFDIRKLDYRGRLDY